MRQIKKQLFELWLWFIAICFTVLIVCSMTAWVAGLAYIAWRWFNG